VHVSRKVGQLFLWGRYFTTWLFAEECHLVFSNVLRESSFCRLLTLQLIVGTGINPRTL
jgi:hypothetical protein